MTMSPGRLTLILILSLLWLSGYNQELRSYKLVKVLSGHSMDIPAESNIYPEFLRTPFFGNVSKFKYGYEDVYRIRYSAPGNFQGVDTVIYKTQRTVYGLPKPYFEGFVVQVSPVIANGDFFAVERGRNKVTLDVLANDESLQGDLSISKLSYISNGQAYISSDGKSILFTPRDKGYAKISYTVCENGACAAALVVIRVDEPGTGPVPDTSRYEIMRDEKATILVGPGFSPPSNTYYSGTLTRLGSQIYEYTPPLGYAGEEVLKFSQFVDGSQVLHVVSVSVKDPFLSNGWNVDDRFYTEVGNDLIIDLTRNDLGGSVQGLQTAGLKGSLTDLGNGRYQFVPAFGFQGQTGFSYLSCGEGRCDQAEVSITVHNYAPLYEVQHLYTAKNRSLELDYQVPIDDYHFSLVQSPVSGLVEIHPDGRGLSYTPNSNYTGGDQFVIQYCVDASGFCQNVSVMVSVQDLEVGECQDCVWPGDHNNDGQVNVHDAVVLATNIGYSGPVRGITSDGFWYGQAMENWPDALAYGTANLKFVDGNGDGLISTTDLQTVSQHYMKSHAIVPSPPPGPDAIPLTLNVLTPVVQAGEWAVIEVSLGSTGLPAYDILGVNFSLEVGSRFVDSSTVQFTLEEDGIFNPVNSVIAFAKSPKDGTIDVGIGKIDKDPIKGHGVLGQIKFIVEEDLNGFRSLKDLIKVKLEAKRVGILTSQASFSLSGSTSYLDLGRRTIVSTKAYPNPADTWITIQGPVQSVRLHNLQGQLLQVWDRSEIDTTLDVSQLPPGSYLLMVTNPDGQSSIERFEIVR